MIPNLAVYNSIHLLSQRFCGVGLHMGLLWILCSGSLIRLWLSQISPEGSTSKLIPVVGRIQLAELLVEGLHLFLPTWTSLQSISQHGACFIRLPTRTRARECTRREIMIFFFKFIFGCTRSSLLHTGFLQASWGSSFLWCGLLFAVAFLVVEHGLQGAQALVAVMSGLSSCGAWTWLPQGMWDLPRPGIKPASPSLAGGCLISGSSGKSNTVF